jgi:hypothetical protein
VADYRHPIPSIQLKAQRRGLEDFEYLCLLAEKMEAVNGRISWSTQ